MKIVLVSNGSLAQSLLDSMKNYFSEPELTAVCFESPDWQKGRDALAWAIRKQLRKNPQERFLVLCDVFGSTAFIESAILMEKLGLHDQSLLLCGMNLPMVFRLYGLRDTATLELCRSIYGDAPEQNLQMYA